MESVFRQRMPIFQQLLDESKFILQQEIERENIKVHAIPSRIKDYESFIKKAKRMESNNPFVDIKDIVGLRVICLLRSDIERIGELIRSSFCVVSEDNKIDGQEVSSFGYQSVHFLAKMKSEYMGPRYDSIKDQIFEVQVRTVAMDAWAIVSHYLDYKTDHDVPKDMRKDFYALSGLFYVVDTHFELFYQAGEESKSDALERIEGNELLNEEVNIDTLRAYLANKIRDHELTEHDVEGYSDLIVELNASGYTLISELDSAIERGMEAFLAYELENPPGDFNKRKQNRGDKYSVIGLVRGLMSIVDDKYIESRIPKVNPDEYIKYRDLVKD